MLKLSRDYGRVWGCLDVPGGGGGSVPGKGQQEVTGPPRLEGINSDTGKKSHMFQEHYNDLLILDVKEWKR